MIRLLEHLTTVDEVKVCLSSRPWNIYKDAFRSCPQLRLELLTKEDISRYVRRNPQEDERFDMIAEELIEKADGVFLWVILVVRDILKVARDGGRSRDLIQTLRDSPPELDDYFKRMMGSIDPYYRRDASTIMQIALCNLDFEVDDPTNGKLLQAGPELLLIHLHYLYEYDDPGFASKDSFKPLNYLEDKENIDYSLESLDRRLSSRCMGLLEPSFPVLKIYSWENRVKFLHRTVKDFLCIPNARKILLDYTNGPYPARTFRCSVLAAHFMSLNLFPAFEDNLVKLRLLSCFLVQARLRSIAEEILFSLFEKMTAKTTSLRLSVYAGTDGILPFLRDYDEDWTAKNRFSLTIAIQCGWESYVRESRKTIIGLCVTNFTHTATKSALRDLRTFAQSWGRPKRPLWTRSQV